MKTKYNVATGSITGSFITVERWTVPVYPDGDGNLWYYDPETDSVRWTDSNMKGKSINGERYAYVQYDAVKEIDWFIDAFCRSKYGATIYRLRDDIIYAE